MFECKYEFWQCLSAMFEFKKFLMKKGYFNKFLRTLVKETKCICLHCIQQYFDY